MSKKNNRNQPQPTTGNTETVTQQRPAHIDSGDAARGEVNARENQTRTQPEPSPVIAGLGDTVIAMRPPKGARNDIFEQRRESLSERGQLQHQATQKARQMLAQAADLYGEGGSKAKEADKIAGDAAVILYRARVGGALSAEQLSSLCVDTFGAKKKGGGDAPVKPADPDASKTPFGQGEAIRKRVVRAVQAFEFINGGEPSRFFDGLPKDAIKTVLDRVETSDLSLYRAYDLMGDIKRNAVTRVHPAFDPKRVAQMVEALTEEGAAAQFVANPALTDAYLALRDILVEVGREAGELAAKKEAA